MAEENVNEKADFGPKNDLLHPIKPEMINGAMRIREP
jgi:hypothetical protein